MNKIYTWFFLLFSALLLSACGANSNNPESVALSYVKNVYNGDGDAVVALIDMETDKMKESEKEATKEMMSGKMKIMVAEKNESAKEQGGVKNIEAGEVKHSKDNEHEYASVPVTITFNKDNQKENTSVRLIKTKDGWKVRL